MSSPIKDVSDTAFWIAYHRRLESERSDALFHDPFAAKLAGEHGRKISEGMPTSRVVAWTVALRTRIIDEFVEFAINAGEQQKAMRRFAGYALLERSGSPSH
jgi:O-methyltransferase involved in polyketide biosynthesis